MEKIQRAIILYNQDCSWEPDYVLKELLADVIPLARIFFLTSDQLVKYREQHPHERRFLIFSTTTVKVDQMKAMMQSFKPHVTFSMSDEFGDRPDFCDLADFTRVFFHQHRFVHYNRKANMIQIPLGFKTGFVYPSDPKPSTEREFKWSFVGTLKKGSDREEMLRIMSQFSSPYFVQTDGGVSTKTMGEIYSKSVFVPNCRGDVVLDCFRLYEAMFAGAIPVVVGKRQELRQTFLFNGPNDFPPFLVANSWSQAAIRCTELLQSDNEQTLLDLQQSNLAWIRSHVHQIRAAVREVCVDNDK